MVGPTSRRSHLTQHHQIAVSRATITTADPTAPHRSLPHRATPATLFDTMPKALPGNSRDTDTHARIRHDRVDDSGSVTLRVNGRLHHIGIARTRIILLVHDLHVRIANAITGEPLRELTIDPTRDYQPTGAPKGPTRK